MVLSLTIAIVTCLTMIASVLFFPKIRVGLVSVDSYWVVVLCGAAVMLATRRVDLGFLWSKMTESSSVNPLKILTLFISMTVLSIFLDEVGFFRYLANKALSFASHSQTRLFVILYVTVSILTVFTSNDIVVLTFTPFICYFAKNASISPTPYLVAEFVAANTMSMTFIIGNPTNIYIASSYDVNFVEYASVMVLPTLGGSVVAFLVLRFLFRRELKTPADAAPEEVKIENKPVLVIGLAVLAVCTVVLAVGSYIGVDMWIAALVSALVLFVLIGIAAAVEKKLPRELALTLKRAPWQLIPFVLSMFIVILALQENGVTEAIGSTLGESAAVFKYGVSSFLAANLINNIPMSVLFCPVIRPLADGASAATLSRAVYATVVGSNIGAYLTPIGALAGIMWMSLLKKHELKFGYLDFIKYGALVSIPTLFAVLSILTLTV